MRGSQFCGATAPAVRTDQALLTYDLFGQNRCEFIWAVWENEQASFHDCPRNIWRLGALEARKYFEFLARSGAIVIRIAERVQEQLVPRMMHTA